MSGNATTLKDGIENARQKLSGASTDLRNAAKEIDELGNNISKALASGDAAELRKVIGSDPSALASALSAPVSIERIAVYPVENFGSAMSPLYTTLALWIGALLMPIVWIAGLVFCILAAMKASSSEAYRYPISLRLIK